MNSEIVEVTNPPPEISETSQSIITGFVTDCQTNEPFNGANITVKTQSGGDVASTTTDEKGYYELAFESIEKSFKVIASFPGHVSAVKDVNLGSSNDPNDPKLYGEANFQLGTLNLVKGSWDDIGLDHNNVNQGPNQFLIQIRVTNNAATTAENVSGTLLWTTTNSYINLAPGQDQTVFLGDIAPGATVDLFYLVEVTRNAAARNTTRNYSITVAGDNTGAPADTITGQLYVRPLISQNRNNVVSITVTNPTPVIGETFALTVVSTTASATYEIVDLPMAYNPALVKPLSYTVTYGANSSNNIRLDNPGTTNFVSVWIFEALSAGTNEFLAIITDKSGQSYHYNSDFGKSNIVEVIPKADLAVTKTVDDPNPTVGDTINFTINVTNNGPNPATGVIMADTVVPASSLTLNAATPSKGTWNPATGIWTIGDLNVGETVTLVFSALVNQIGQITNIAHVSGNEEDPNLTNNQSIVVLSSEQLTTDLAIFKTVNNATTNVGQNVQFTLTVLNDGPDIATGVIVTDTWPSGFQLLAATPSQGTFSQLNPTTYQWIVGTLANKATATLIIDARALQTGTWTNTGVVTGNEYDPHLEDNTSSVDVTVNPTADLAVLKQVCNCSTNVGQTINFTISVINYGPNNATGVILNDLLPPGLSFVSATPSQGSYNPATGIWNIGNLNNGATATLQLFATITATGQINNVASVTGNEYDPNLTNNQDVVTINSQPSADLNLQKTVDQPLTDVGKTVIFDLILKNVGPNTATNVVVNDILPSGLTYLNSIPSQGTYNSGTGVWNVGTLVNQAIATLKIVARADEVGIFTNIATASSDVYDPLPEDNTDAATVQVRPSADLAITKTVEPLEVLIGENVIFTLTVSNLGPNAATGVVVNDLLPVGLSFVSANPSKGTYNNLTGIWAIGEMNKDDIETLTIEATVNTEGAILNIATVSGNEYDPNPTNNQGLAQVNGEPSADLSITKNVCDCTPYVGQNINYIVTLTNNGPSDATGVTVADILPPQVTFVSATPSKGNYNQGSNIWEVGDLANGETVTLNIIVTVKESGSITNTVIAQAEEPDPIPSNNEASETIEAQASADIQVVKAVTPTTQNYGKNVTHTITVTNLGPSNATNVVVADVRENALDLIYVSHTLSQGTYDPVSGIWQIGSISGTAPNNKAVINITFKVNTTGFIENSAVKTNQDQYDPDTSNDTSTVILKVPPAAALYIKVNTTSQCIEIGNNVLIQLKLGNRGPDMAENVVVRWVVPQGMEFVSATPEPGYGTASYDAATRTVTWKVGNLPIIDPYLNIIVRLLKPGKYLISPTIDSDTYNLTPQDITPANVCAISTNGNGGNGGKRVPMQPTGIPVLPLVIGALTVFAGFLIPRRKLKF
ncbi:MAG: carboxypeptidase regulatory-like domain-containing protein [Methanobacteriaceae archaeon]|nr:carboxypeptidase regulatory-like domain-containing protein [Methanobacteriaceae archaeon]